MLLTDELLLNYKRCRRRTYLDFYGDGSHKKTEKDFIRKLREENRQQIADILSGQEYSQPYADRKDYAGRANETLILMKQGAESIFKGVLSPATVSESNPYLKKIIKVGTNLTTTESYSPLNLTGITLLATPTLLQKQPGKSLFGDWYYVPTSVKLGRRPKPEYQIVAAFQALLLAQVQGMWTDSANLILRRQNPYAVNLNRWIPRLYEILTECLEMMRDRAEPEVFISRQRCSLCRWYDHCYSIAQTEQHLSLVPGITPSRYQALQAAGLANLEAVASTTVEQLQKAIGADVATKVQRQAQAIVENKAILLPHPQATIPTDNIELYFDIEAEPERNLDYLLGVLVVNHAEGTEEFHAFLAEKPEEEEAVWQEFLIFISQYPQAPIFHYSEYEVETIKRLGRLYQTPQSIIQEIIPRLIDLHRKVTILVTLPVENYSLKTLANWLGFQWRDLDASGDQSVCWYDNWLKEGNRDLLFAILRYNEDDCRATYHLKTWLVNFLAENGS